MRLSTLKISGFRNWSKAHLSFDPEKPLSVFIGSNGHGKTNFLESIYLLALGKSFRARENEELIGFADDFCRVEGDFEGADRSEKLEFIVTRSPAKKTLKCNGVITKAMDFIGHLRVVFFSPDDMNMIHHSPQLRRRYLDVLISQVDPEYLHHLLNYQEALRQRNALLKRVHQKQAAPDELSFWNVRLAAVGHPIQARRREVLRDLIPTLSLIYQEISQGKAVPNLCYESTVPEGDLATYEKTLEKALEADLWRGATQVGPHRDDVEILLDEKPLAAFGSRGEWRSMILALKMAEMEWIKQQTGEYPLLMLDDVFSELDEARQRYLVGVLAKTQTFLTTAYESVLKLLSVPHVVYQVEDGTLKKLDV